jgi:predicted nucleic acid-binding protein
LTGALIYLDTNIFVALYEGSAGRATPVIELVEAARTQAHPVLATSELTLAELLVGSVASGDEDLARLYESNIVSSAWLNVSAVSRRVLKRAAVVRANLRRLKLPDAIHVATAIELRCSHLLTADAGIATPLTASRSVSGEPAESSIKVVRPDEQSMRALIKEL